MSHISLDYKSGETISELGDCDLKIVEMTKHEKDNPLPYNLFQY